MNGPSQIVKILIVALIVGWLPVLPVALITGWPWLWSARFVVPVTMIVMVALMILLLTAQTRNAERLDAKRRGATLKEENDGITWRLFLVGAIVAQSAELLWRLA